jgi:hypothetical protein
MKKSKFLLPIIVSGLFFSACSKQDLSDENATAAGQKHLASVSNADTVLKVYNALDQIGNAGGLTILKNLIYRAYNDPNSGPDYAALNTSFINNIESFYLPQGYQAVFADSVNGRGESICYVAAKSAINQNLPLRLRNKVSFIRLIPIKAAKKLGAGYTDQTAVTKMGSSWFYDWGSSDYSRYNPDQMYAPMAWGKNAYAADKIQYYISKKTVDHILGFNEPDNPVQSNTSPSDAVVYYKELLKTGLRTGSPACEEQNAFGTGKWLPEFMSLASQQKVRVDFIAIHWYDWANWGATGNTNPDPQYVLNRFKTYLQNVHNAYPDKPIWITEFNANKNRVGSVHEAFMALAVAWMNEPAQAYIERYAYFFPPALPAIDANGNLTSIGTKWRDLNTGIVSTYSQNVIPN